jgi:hypothetical protein
VPAARAGRIYTDAIDNSAGVDCSDHEVNIKILVGLVEAEGELTEKQRNKILAEMTDDVGRLVLADNYYQTQSLSVGGLRADKMLDAQAAFIRALERAGKLNRAVEFLPSDDEIAERRLAKTGLASPERAVPPCVLEDGALRRAPRLAARRRRLRRAVARKLLPAAPSHPLRRLHAAAPASPGDHRDRPRELDDQPHGQRLRAPDAGRDGRHVRRCDARLHHRARHLRHGALWAQIDALDNKVPARCRRRC